MPGPDGARLLMKLRGPAYSWTVGWPEAISEMNHVFATREITSVAGSDQFGANDHRDLISRLHESSTGMFSAAGGIGSTLELRYVTEPNPGSPTRVRLFITAKMLSHDDERDTEVIAMVERACSALPLGYQSAPVSSEAVRSPVPSEWTVVEVRKQEQILQPQVIDAPTDYYYAPLPVLGDGTGWAQFGRVLADLSAPVVVSILFEPTQLHGVESDAIGSIVTTLEALGSMRQEPDVRGGMRSMPADASASAALPIWKNFQTSLRHCLLVRATVVGARPVALSVARSLATAVTLGPGGAQGTKAAIQIPDDAISLGFAKYSLNYGSFYPWGGIQIWQGDDAPLPIRRIPYLFSPDEAATFAVLPVPEADGAPGFPRARRSDVRRTAMRDVSDDGPSIKLGDTKHEGGFAGDANLPLKAINRHVLVVGAPGSGKTMSVLSLLVRLWREQQIPFLAIEPTKTEYRSMLTVPGMEQLRVIVLGRDDIAPFRMNPLAPPRGVRVETHINSLMASFRASLPLSPPLPQLLLEAIESCYEAAGWEDDMTTESGPTPPTLGDLLQEFETGFEKHGYSGEIRDNLMAALRLRLRSLTRGARGKVLNTVESVDFEELMHRPVVFELDEIADPEDKAVFAAFILDRIRASARFEGPSGGKLRHVTVLEEAHRLLSRSGAQDADSPQAAAIRAFCEAIAELRALGEGFVVSSQSPSALAEAAVANCGTRIIHRLESAADRDVVLSDLGANDAEREGAARLAMGEAVVRWPQLDELEFVQVRAADGVDSGKNVTNEEVQRRMASESQGVRRLLPYRLCTRGVCTSGCDPAVRLGGEKLARSLGDEASLIWKEHSAGFSALGPIASKLASGADSQQLAYCGGAHLAVRGDAFVVPGKDIRGALAKEISSALSSTNAGIKESIDEGIRRHVEN